MRQSVILSACRTPIGKFQGALAMLSAPELGSAAIQAAVSRAGIAAERVDEVIMGNVLSAGIGQAPARQAALKAGLPSTVAALTVNKVCGSGLKAIMLADQSIRAGDAEVVVAGGMESMSRSPLLLERDGAKIGDRKLVDSMLNDGLLCAFSGNSMGEIAENLAASDGLTRQAQDELAEESHRRAISAAQTGMFDAELVALRVAARSGEQIVPRDEGPRPETSLARLGSLRPVFSASGTITAGNASMISDGAAAAVIASAEFARQNRLEPLARIVAAATAGGEPRDLFVAPVAAVRKVLAAAGLTTRDIDLFEINEAFAAQMLACLRRLELSPDRVNVHGGAIALGHPIGASGARVLATLVHALIQQRKQRGLAALCLGGGNAVAMILETATNSNPR